MLRRSTVKKKHYAWKDHFKSLSDFSEAATATNTIAFLQQVNYYENRCSAMWCNGGEWRCVCVSETRRANHS